MSEPADQCVCGNPIVQPQVGRKRKRCTRCSPPNRRGKLQAVPASGVPAAGEAPGERVPGEVESSLRAVFELAGRFDRYQAVLAIRLARQLDSATSVAGAQGLAQQIDALAGKALEGWEPDPPAPDFADDLVARRRAVEEGTG